MVHIHRTHIYVRDRIEAQHHKWVPNPARHFVHLNGLQDAYNLMLLRCLFVMVHKPDWTSLESVPKSPFKGRNVDYSYRELM